MPFNPLLPADLPLVHPSTSTPRALLDIQIPNAVNISPILKGINLGMVNGLSGLHALIFPYTNMDEGDEITVFFDTMPVFTSHVVNANEVFDFFIPYGAFRPGTDQIVAIHYRVVRVSTGAPEDSQPSQFRIKLTRPGGRDPSAEPWHQNLFAPVLPDPIIADGVSESDALEGFKVTIKPYQNMAYHDVIDLRWNGERLPPRLVLPTEVNGSVEIDITMSTIEAGGDGTDLEIFYRVYDEVENVSEGADSQPWSMITLVYVHADTRLLPEAVVPEAPNNKLRLADLGSNDVHVLVTTSAPEFVSGNPVVMTWLGQTLTGEEVRFDQPLVVANVPGLLTFTVPNATATAIAGGQAYVSYVLYGANGAKSSRLRRIEVEGEAVVTPLTRTEDFQSLSVGQIPVGGNVSTQLLTVTNQSGQMQIDSAWAATERVLRFAAGAHFSIEVAGAGSQGIVFFLDGPSDSFDSVRFYNLQNELVLTQTQLAVGANSVAMPADKTFSRMECTCRSAGDLDSIVLYASPLNLVHFQQARLGDLQLNVPLDLGAATVTKTSVAGVATITKFVNTLPVVLTASLSGVALSFAPKEVARAFTLASYGGSLQGALYFYNATGALILTSAGFEGKPGVRHFAMPAGEQLARVEYQATDGNYLGIYYVCFSS